MANAPLTGTPNAPYSKYKFKVNLGIGEKAGFSKVTGLESEFDVVEYRAGNDPITPDKYPGLMKFPNIVLEQGLSSDNALIKWHEEVADIGKSGNLSPDGKPDPKFRRTFTIELYSKASTSPVKIWEVRRGWPCKLSEGELDSMSGDIAIISCEIAHAGLKRIL